MFFVLYMFSFLFDSPCFLFFYMYLTTCSLLCLCSNAHAHTFAIKAMLFELCPALSTVKGHGVGFISLVKGRLAKALIENLGTTCVSKAHRYQPLPCFRGLATRSTFLIHDLSIDTGSKKNKPDAFSHKLNATRIHRAVQRAELIWRALCNTGSQRYPVFQTPAVRADKGGLSCRAVVLCASSLSKVDCTVMKYGKFASCFRGEFQKLHTPNQPLVKSNGPNFDV